MLCCWVVVGSAFCVLLFLLCFNFMLSKTCVQYELCILFETYGLCYDMMIPRPLPFQCWSLIFVSVIALPTQTLLPLSFVQIIILSMDSTRIDCCDYLYFFFLGQWFVVFHKWILNVPCLKSVTFVYSDDLCILCLWLNN